MVKKLATPFITEFENIPADALVPEDNQPYEIPGHWKWVRLGAVLHGMETRKPSGDIFMYIDIDSVDNALQEIREPKHVQTSKAPSRASRAVHAGATLFSMVRPYLRNIALIEDDLAEAVASTGFYVCKPIDVVDSVFLFEYLRSEVFIDLMTTKMRGDNSPSIRADDLREAAFPLPPIDEQKAIVEKLQSTNQKIDDVLERLDQFLDQAPRQRAAIIQAGVSGMLTEDWRAENGQSREDWVESTLGGTFRWASGGTPARSNKAYFQGHIPWIKSGELPDGLIDGVAEYITEDAISSSSAKVFPKDSVAIAMYGATIGRTGILAFDAATNQAVAVAAKNEEVDSRFLFYFLQSSRERFMSLGKGGAQPNISQTVIKSFPFEYPVGDEQGEIVAVIEAVLSGIETAYKITLDVREKVQAAKRAVRNRALRGIV